MKKAKDPTRKILTPEGIQLTFTLATVGSRATAFIIDWLIIIMITMLLAGLTTMAGGGGTFYAFFILGLFMLRTFYFSFFEIYWQGSTPGKRSQGIRVIDGRGGPLEIRAIFARNLTREIEVFLPLTILFNPSAMWPGAEGWIGLFAGMWAFILFLLPLLNADNLRVGDLIAGTQVVDMPKPALLSDLTGQAHRFTFSADQLNHYGNYELQVLEDLLRGTPSADTEALVCERIRRRIQWNWPSNEHPAPIFLRDFYAAQRAHLERGLLFGIRHTDKTAARQANKR